MISTTLALRLAGAVAGAASFGLVTAPLLAFPWFFSAFLLAFGFGTVFMIGTGYRIILATLANDPNRSTAASWTGATTAVTVTGMALWLALPLEPVSSARLLAGLGLALNVSYLPVKRACQLAGCCRAAHSRIASWPDLRSLEIALTGIAICLALLVLLSGSAAVSAAIALGAHLIIRLFSRWARLRLPGNLLYEKGMGAELGPIAALTILAGYAVITGSS